MKLELLHWKKNSYKVIKLGISSNTLTSLTVNDINYTNKEDIVEQLNNLKYCVIKGGGAPYNMWSLCIVGNGTPYNTKIKLVVISMNVNNLFNLLVNIYEINRNDLSVIQSETKVINME